MHWEPADLVFLVRVAGLRTDIDLFDTTHTSTQGASALEAHEAHPPPPPLPTAAAHHPETLATLLAPVIPTVKQAASTAETLTTHGTPINERLDAAERTRVILQNALRRARLARVDLKHRPENPQSVPPVKQEAMPIASSELDANAKLMPPGDEPVSVEVPVEAVVDRASDEPETPEAIRVAVDGKHEETRTDEVHHPPSLPTPSKPTAIKPPSRLRPPTAKSIIPSSGPLKLSGDSVPKGINAMTDGFSTLAPAVEPKTKPADLFDDVSSPLSSIEVIEAVRISPPVKTRIQADADSDEDEDLLYEGKSVTLRDILVRAGDATFAHFDILHDEDVDVADETMGWD
ncbi:hypothetical protein BV25DRAFT_1658711 [Artomyces pyxidatus]|uniref:Uncharacterized protein n=1 Tax=Artomyces pyxidatus TaxID=48021 RepID=A0ACB8SJ16_9AGAM|nr:hypothetical protein BV25DRAFT_1658711 [Artomyces pyxidatus]